MNSRHVAVALIELPSKIHMSDPRYGGAIITNPGMHEFLHDGARHLLTGHQSGQGELGINLARAQGYNIQIIVDSPASPDDTRATDLTNKSFDTLSFDPRDIGFTKLSFICFPDAAQRMIWVIDSDAEQLLEVLV